MNLNYVYHSADIPFTLIFVFNVLTPFAPSTYKVVLRESIGINTILNEAAVALAITVFIDTGRLTFSRANKAPVLEAVSKKYIIFA